MEKSFGGLTWILIGIFVFIVFQGWGNAQNLVVNGPSALPGLPATTPGAPQTTAQNIFLGISTATAAIANSLVQQQNVSPISGFPVRRSGPVMILQ